MTGIIAGLIALASFGGAVPSLPAEAAQDSTVKYEEREAHPDEFTNVRLDLVITDQTTSSEAVKKSVTLLLVNGGEGRVRSQGMIFREATASDRRSAFEVTLNADARIVSISGDRVRTMITVEYAPSAEGGEAGPREQRGSTLNQSVWVALENGKPTVIVQSSDPLSDRKVTLEAKATILR